MLLSVSSYIQSLFLTNVHFYFLVYPLRCSMGQFQFSVYPIQSVILSMLVKIQSTSTHIYFFFSIELPSYQDNYFINNAIDSKMHEKPTATLGFFLSDKYVLLYIVKIFISVYKS